jgi:hypothetical protein
MSASGLPDGIHIFETKNPNLGKFWRALEWKRLVYEFNGNLDLLWQFDRYISWIFGLRYDHFGTFYGHLVI